MIGYLLASVLFTAGEPHAAPELKWSRLPSLPDRHGFAGMFVGVSGGALICAGGANFPEKKPWEGGAKVWHDGVFALERPDGPWINAGKLPRPLAYGATVTFADSVVCAGGSDARRHYQNSFRLRWRGGALQTEQLPPLPFPIANGCAALVGGTLFVCGGQSEPTGLALDSLLAMDLEAKPLVWRTPASRPGGGRILSIAASAGGEFWSIGGATIEVGPIGKPARRYQTDVYSYKEGRGWRRRADLPAALAAAPSPAPTIGDRPAVLGGDDGTQASLAPERHRGFSKNIWVYDTASERWKETDAVAAPRVTTGIAEWRGGWAIPSGEVRPGIRSSEVWRITFKK